MQTVKLDFDGTDLFILADGDWQGFRSRACEKEPETTAWIRSFATSGKGPAVLWDIGASVGSYSLIAAALGHSVVAFEPFAPSYGHLQQNVWVNRLDESVVTVPFALGAGAGKPLVAAKLRVRSVTPGSASHGGSANQNFQWIVVTSADQAADIYEAPDHVKIDVDGEELGVIEGGRTVWPLVESLMVESEPGTIENIEIILAAAGLQRVEAHRRMGDTRQHNYLFKRVDK